ncbi:substrate-binding domain-containing protein [Fodinibius salicampi]|uniref:substrate-binding domain-containing protein n=1 Tax=Fodinibius salicampi TaxID=1920655 RepID=UPI003313EF55
MPGDIALLGYGDLPICQQARPTITSISTDSQKLGKATIDKLMKLILQSDCNIKTTSYILVSVLERESA